MLLRLLGRISSVEEGKLMERKVWEKKSRFKNKGAGKNVKLQGTLYTPRVLHWFEEEEDKNL